jgi:chemotaxis response regulator CheB
VIVLAPAKILVVDDQEFVRRTLCSLLDQQPHWKVYEAEDGIAAVDRALEIKPDVSRDGYRHAKHEWYSCGL